MSNMRYLVLPRDHFLEVELPQKNKQAAAIGSFRQTGSISSAPGQTKRHETSEANNRYCLVRGGNLSPTSPHPAQYRKIKEFSLPLTRGKANSNRAILFPPHNSAI